MLTKHFAKPYDEDGREPLRLDKIDYLELYVGNLVQASHFFRAALGFVPISHGRFDADECTRESMVLSQANIRLVLSAPLGAHGAIAEHVRIHGDGVKDVAFSTADAAGAFEEAVKRGARPISEPVVLEDQRGCVIKATIEANGDMVHSFIQRDGCDRNFLPNYQPIDSRWPPSPMGVIGIDHVALSVERNDLDRCVDFYSRIMDFHLSHQEEVSTEYSGMNSKVVQNSGGSIKLPMMEPAAGKRKSQIQDYLDFHQGPGVQHIALLSDNIVSTVRSLRANGIDFLRTPDAYYEMVEKRLGGVEEDIGSLRELGILVDHDGRGYLLQTFSQPIQSRPTMFIEVIQRKGATGFGGGNIGALFRALEQEQALRGPV